MYQLLMVDDEPALLAPHRIFLEQRGCAVAIASTPGEAVLFLSRHTCDLLFLDVKMPEISGFDLCAQLRLLTKAPIVFLSSLSQDADQLQGFSAGASDYIPKDCPLELFWARVNARLSQAELSRATRAFPPLTLDLHHQQAFINDLNLHLTQTEFLLLSLLSSRPRTIWTIDTIYRELWGDSGPVNPTAVQVHLSRMRCKMEDAFPQHEFIETVWRKGYQFVPRDA